MNTASRLIILCGLPGSGKTTLAVQLEEKWNALRLSADEWMQAISIDLWDENKRGKVEALQWQLAQDFLRRGGVVVIEWGSWSRQEREVMRKGARALGAAVELRYLSASPDVLFERVRRRGRENPPITRGLLQEWSNAIEVPTAEEMALFDPPADADR
jgi:predicted kinase